MSAPLNRDSAGTARLSLWQGVDSATARLRTVYANLVAVSVLCGIGTAAWLLNPTSPSGYIAAGTLLLCFTLLFGWVASNFWMTVIGFARFRRIRREARRQARSAEQADDAVGDDMLSTPRTAIAVPIYNEDAGRVFGAVQAMMDSLESHGALDGFHFYILSDSTDPSAWLQEERAWLALAAKAPYTDHIFYRRRDENSERKSGNIKDFLETWGHGYQYMVPLDADSVVDGATLIELVRRMDRDPALGLLQTWPRVVGGNTLFARLHRYAAGLYGRILACGMAALAGPHGNYWGHNAIVRVDAFMACCGLPNLPGRAPLGGEILSHDFVEAALLVRAGWKVEIAADLDGSYEDGPPNLIQHIKRDQRWCQGNLQHTWLLLAHGIHPMSRMNFLIGILAYAASPIWIVFVMIAAVMVITDQSLFAAGLVLAQDSAGQWQIQTSSLESLLAIGLLGTTAAFILAPKLIGVVAALMDREERPHRLAVNVATETVLSVLVAPTVMIRHTMFIVRLLFGAGVSWDPQQRESDRVAGSEAARAFAPQTLLALALAGAAVVWPSPLYLWLAPVLAGPALSIPITVLTGRRLSGSNRLLVADADKENPPILRATFECRQHIEAVAPYREDPVGAVLDETDSYQTHMLYLATRPTDAQDMEPIDDSFIARARSSTTALEPDERKAILASPSVLQRLRLERFCTPPEERLTAFAAAGSGEIR